jgi:tagatose 6-phosphate kinase
MIVVAGFNTAIDKLVEIDRFVPGRVIRARTAQTWPGGKGVHVALCAAALGEKVRLVGVIDRGCRDWVAGWLRERYVDFHGVDSREAIRTCLAVRDAAGLTTEILEPGPAIEADVWRALTARFETLCDDAAIAVLSGSLPPGAPESGYRDLVRDLDGLRVLVDASGQPLRLVVDAEPFAIKPNRQEAEALTGLTIESAEDGARAAQALASMGLPLVIISLGASGAVACWQHRICRIEPPAPAALNVVGAGDCLLAGVAVGLTRGYEMEDVLRLGVACGTAKVLSPETGVVRRRDIDLVLPDVTLKWLE